MAKSSQNRPAIPDQVSRSLLKSVSSGLVKWGLPTSGFGAAVYGILQHDWTVAIVSSVAMVIVSLFTIFKKFTEKVVNRVLQKIETRIYRNVDVLADWIVSKLENALLRLWWYLTSNFQGDYYQRKLGA